MNEQVEKLLASTSNETFTKVARSVLGDESAKLAGALTFNEITNSHNDDRTIGIVKVTGTAESAGIRANWSSVVKVIDLSKPPNSASHWVFPENESKVYDLGLFAEDELPLRPAKCYWTESSATGITILWLEDLSGALQPPWNIEQFVDAASHIGQINGHHSVNATELPIKVARDSFSLRLDPTIFRSNYDRLLERKDDEIVRRFYVESPVESGVQLAAQLVQIFEISKKLPHDLCIGDSHARDLFPMGEVTVGIDWATLTQDPMGCDIGVLLGSAVSFTGGELDLVARHERDIFDSYMEGLQSTGWSGNLDHVRIGFFAQFAGYLARPGFMALNYANLPSNEQLLRWAEHRFGVPYEEFPEAKSGVIAMYPEYVEELTLLLERVEKSL